MTRFPEHRPAGGGSAGRQQGRRLGVLRDDQDREFHFPDRDRKTHTHIIGGSGSGKSKLLELLIRHDVADRNAGVCLIDPHGSAYDALVHYLSHRRPDLARRVILFDPADQAESVLGFNPLGPLAWENPYFALNAVLTGILKTWGQGNINETPRIGRWLENILTVLISNRLTLLEALPLISAAKNSSERQLLVRTLNVELVRQDWEEYDQATSQQRHAYIEGPHNRMRKLLRSAFIRNMFGVQRHLLDVRRVIEERQILLVKLAPNDQIDADDMRMIGILLIHELFRAALRRDPNRRLAPFHLYIDEFAQYVTDDIAYMLDQCRKFGLFLTLAHQHLEQLKRENEYLYASVMTNCRNRVAFGSLSYRDAELLSQEIDTGSEDLLEVKYRTEQTKFRPIEELRATYSCGGTATEGFAAAWQQGLSLGNSVGRTLARATTTGRSLTESSSESENLARSATIARMLGKSRGESASHMESESSADSAGAGMSQTASNSRSRGETAGTSESSGATELFGAGETASRSQLAYGINAPVTRVTGESEQHQRGESTQETASRSVSSGATQGASQGKSLSVQHVDGRAVADTAGHQSGTSESLTSGSGETRASGRSEQRGQTVTSGETETAGESATASISRQFSLSGTRQESSGRSWSVAVSPFHRMEEFKETQEHYFSLPEQRHRLVAELKNQGVGEATFRIGQRPRVRVAIDRVVAPPWLPVSSPGRVKAFRQAVYNAHPAFYQTPAAAKAEIDARQTGRFDRVFDYEWFPDREAGPEAVVVIPPATAAPARLPAPEPVPPPKDVSDEPPAAAEAVRPAHGRRFTR